MDRKMRNAAKLAFIAILLAFLLPTLAAGAAAASGYCAPLFPQSIGIFPNGSSSSFGTMIVIAVLAMLAMLSLSGIAYAFGRSFGIRRLQNFGRQEVVEVLLTGIIVLVFIGTFTIGNSLSTSPNAGSVLSGPTNGQLTYGTFSNACTALSSAAITGIGNVLTLSVDQALLSVMFKLRISAVIKFIGIVFWPGYGFWVTNMAINEAVSLSGALIAASMGTVALLSIIYQIFPLFLYAGIVLRTLPWTRRAGGSFLGLFFGFYIFFPLMLAFMVGINASLPQLAVISPISLQINGVSGLLSLFSTKNVVNTLLFNSGTLFDVMVNNMLAPLGAVLIEIVISLYFAFNVSNSMGEVLGSQSLRISSVMRHFI